MKTYEIILQSINKLSRREKFKFFAAFMFQTFLSGLELFGVLLFSILANLILTQNLYIPNDIIQRILVGTLLIDEQSVASQIALLGLLVILIFFSRTIFTAIYLRRLSFFLVRKTVDVQGMILRNLLENTPTKFEKFNKQELQLILTRGVATLFNRNLGGLATISSDLVLVFAVVLGLFVFDATLMCFTLVIFTIAAFTISKVTRHYIIKNASEEKSGEVASKTKIYEILDNFKDFYFNSNHTTTVIETKLPLLKQGLSATRLAFVPVFNRYLSEALLLLMIFVMSAIVFYRFETRVALSVLATFVLGLSRLIPALFRIQQQFQQIRISMPFGRSAAELIQSMGDFALSTSKAPREGFDSLEDKVLKLESVSFRFELSEEVISSISTEFRTNQTTVIVGTSGAGKTTLVDLISGFRDPSQGRILWKNLELKRAVRAGQLRIGYVAQDAKLISGTLRENILMNRSQITDKQIREAIRICNLGPLIASLENGEETQLGEGQRILSGGEVQRIGLARAIVQEPQLLILDEFTSSLDLETESKILQNLLKDVKNSIVISVAHRTSAISHFDRVIQLADKTISFDGATKVWLSRQESTKEDTGPVESA